MRLPRCWHRAAPTDEQLLDPACAPYQIEDPGHLDWDRFDKDADDRGYAVAAVRWNFRWRRPNEVHVTLRRQADDVEIAFDLTVDDHAGPPIRFWERINGMFAEYDRVQAARRDADPFHGQPYYYRISATDQKTGKTVPLTIGDVDEDNALRLVWYGRHFALRSDEVERLPRWLDKLLRTVLP